MALLDQRRDSNSSARSAYAFIDVWIGMMLLVVGGLASLIAVGDPNSSSITRYIGFVALFAGLGALSFSVVPALIAGLIFDFQTFAEIGLVVGYVLGGLGGNG